ncbi:hypothetical protein [Streptomyces hundungensis]|uniref:hypothetical protein n=1 Tax=Streptomyces hundungensis TaxID=1077946 RepID=UPI0013C524EC|nr:hypothetical protein [Streptomyces hundungensis]
MASLDSALEIWREASVSRQGLGEDAVPSQIARFQAARRRQSGMTPPPRPAEASAPTPIADDAIRHLKAGRESDALSLLWHIGQTHTPGEIRDVVAAYSVARETEAADAVLAAASGRRTEDILRITASLLEAKRYSDATALVDAAVQRIG